MTVSTEPAPSASVSGPVEGSSDNNANQNSTEEADNFSSAASKKRGASRQITKDDGEEEDEDIDPDAPMAKASQAVLQKRKILKVSRKEDGSVDWSKKKASNPFATVQLTASSTLKTGKDGESETDKKETSSSNSIFGSNAAFSGFGAVKSSGTGFGSAASGGGFGGFGSVATASSGTSTLSFGNAKGFGALGSANGEETSKTSFQFAKLSENASAAKTDNKGPVETKHTEEATAESGSTEILPTDYKPYSGEENEVVLMEVRCKTHRLGPAVVAPDTTEMNSDGTPSSLALAAVPPSESNLNSTNSKEEETAKHKEAQDKSSASKAEGSNNATKEEKEEGPGESTQTSNKDEDVTKGEMIWHELGVGPVRVLQAMEPKPNGTEGDQDKNQTIKDHCHPPSVVRLVQRRQVNTSAQPTKVLLNVRLFSESTVTQPSDRHVQFATPGGSGPWLFKCGKSEQALDLTKLLKAEIKKAHSCFGGAADSSKTVE